MNIYNFLKSSKAFSLFYNQFINNKAGHAYIIYSKDKLSVEKMTELLSCTFLCLSPVKPCLRCINCKRVLAGNHPDSINFPKKNEKLYVSDIDSLILSASYKPSEGDSKVYTLLNAETMNVQSQNKLLKTLEEPPEGMHIVIGTTNIENLLPTVLSRSIVIEIEKFEAEKIVKFLSVLYDDALKCELASTACGGLVGKAINMLEDEDYNQMQEFAYSLILQIEKIDNVIECMETINAFKDKLDFIETLQLYFRDCLMVNSGLNNLVLNKSEMKNINKAAFKLNAEDFTELIDKTNDLKEKIVLNCNANTVIETLLIDISDKINKH